MGSGASKESAAADGKQEKYRTEADADNRTAPPSGMSGGAVSAPGTAPGTPATSADQRGSVALSSDAWHTLPPGLPSKEELLLAALEDVAKSSAHATIPSVLQKTPTVEIGHEIPPPPPAEERLASNRRPQLRVRRVDDDQIGAIKSVETFRDSAAPYETDIARKKRVEMQRRAHAAKTKQSVPAMRQTEIDANLVAGFQDAMDAAKKRLEISAIEQAELLGLLRVKEKQLEEMASSAHSSRSVVDAPTSSADRCEDDGDDSNVFETPSVQLARLKAWRKKALCALQPWTDRLDPSRRAPSVVEDDRRVLRALDAALRAANTADKEQESRLLAEARFLAARKQLDAIAKGGSGTMLEVSGRPSSAAGSKPLPITDATLRTKLSDNEVDIRRLQHQVQDLENERNGLELQCSQLATELAVTSAAKSSRPGTAISEASKGSNIGAGVITISAEAAQEARANAERLGILEAELISLTEKYEAAAEDARQMKVEQERAIELDAMLKEKTVQLDLMRNCKEQCEVEIRRLENVMEDLTPRRPEEPGYDPDRVNDFEKPIVDVKTHEKLLQLEDQAAEIKQADSEAGLMIYSLQKKDAQIAALQDLYAAATAQAASARRQAEAATTLNENLILARTAPHHDANRDAKILLTSLRHRAAEQDQFILVLMKRLAILEHFVREEKALVVRRATESVGSKLIESTRRFNVYARKAAEREEFLVKQLGDARKETEKALVASNTLEEHRLFAEKSCEHETRRREQARRQLAVVYRDGKKRDRAYSCMLNMLADRLEEQKLIAERCKRQEADAEERALEAEKAVKRLEYEAKMVQLERQQENAWELKLNLKAKEEQLRALALATTRLQALIHGSQMKQPTFTSQNERVDSLIKQCTMEAADIRGRELLAFDEERKELKGALVQRSAETDQQIREMRAAMEEAIAEERGTAEERVRQAQNTLGTTQQAATEQLVELKGELEAAGQLIDQMELKEKRTSHHLLCYRKIAYRLVQYIADKRRLLGAAAESYRPEEIADYARYLEIDKTDEHLTWIAEEALHAPLPPHWSSHRDDAGDVYFYCGKLDKSSYEHPLDNYYRLLYKELQALYHGEEQDYDSVGKNSHANHCESIGFPFLGEANNDESTPLES